MSIIEKINMTSANRRSFLKGAAGLVVTAQLLSGKAGASMFMAEDHDVSEARFGVFVAIDTDGTVHFTCHRSEMGQQVRTSLAMIVADELEADFSRFKIHQANGDPKYGDQNTDGSRSVRRNFHRLRMVGASIRQLLERAAAQEWGVPAAECRAEKHQVKHGPSGRFLDFGALAEKAAGLTPPVDTDIALKDRKDWRYIGTRQSSVDMTDVLGGRAVYGIDVRIEGMKYAVVARPPVLFGTVKNLDDKATRQMDGIAAVVRMPEIQAPAQFKALGGVAVVADNSWTAIKGREALRIDWDHGENISHNSADYKKSLAAALDGMGDTVRARGNVDQALEEADDVVRADYYVPYLTHAAMEPPMATASYKDGRVEIWASTQTPQATRNTVAASLGLEPDDVTVHVTFLGGGFGRKSKPDYSVEAALLSREIGAPVQVIWTREDDIRHSYYHAVSMQRIEGGLDKKGRTVAWKHRTTFPPIPFTFDHTQSMPSDGEMRLGFVDNPFDVPNMRLERAAAEGHIRIGWVRSVNNINHAFATQSFVAELAHAAGRDQKDYLLEMIGPPRHVDLAAEGATYDNYGDSITDYPIDTARLAAVVRRVAEDSGWDRYKSGSGRALGIAAHRSFLSYIATVVEVEVKDGQVRVPRAWVAADAGTVVNREHVMAQCEGGTNYGLSLALESEVTVKDGAVEQSNFHDYRVLRISEAPRTIHVHIMDSNAAPGGVGEPSTPPALPALANAIFNATGKRIRSLPTGDQLA